MLSFVIQEQRHCGLANAVLDRTVGDLLYAHARERHPFCVDAYRHPQRRGLPLFAELAGLAPNPQRGIHLLARGFTENYTGRVPTPAVDMGLFND